MRRSRSRVVRRAVACAATVVAFSALAAPLTFAHSMTIPDNTYTFDADAQGWSESVGSWIASDPHCDSGGCLSGANGGATDFTSPAVAVPSGATSVSVSLRIHQAGAYSFKITPSSTGVQATVTCTETLVSGVAGNGLYNEVCPYTLPVSSGTVTVAIHSAHNAVEGYNALDTVDFAWTGAAASATPTPGGTGGGSVGTLSYPALDMASITANMQAFFSFMAPALWIVVGISLGGLIVGRLRGLL